MREIIKAGDAVVHANVRSLHAPRNPPLIEDAPQPGIDPELAALRREADGLRRQVEQKDGLIQKHESELKDSFRKGEQAGRAVGLKEATDRQTERLTQLKENFAQALQLYSTQISGLERLAPLLAREGLAKILGDGRQHAELLNQIVRGQIKKLDAEAIIRIEVSREDFPKPQDLADLAQTAGRKNSDIQTPSDLRTGECRIKLKLGTLDVGVNQQWDKLSGALTDLAQPRDAS